MSQLVNFNGTGYNIPTAGETGWATAVTSLLADLGANAATLTTSQNLSNKLILHASGSFSAPSVSFQGDSNTGIYQGSSDNINFATAGALRLTIDGTGVITATTAQTAAVDTSNPNLATNAFVINQAAAATPLLGTSAGAVGTSTRFARADHQHPPQITGLPAPYTVVDVAGNNNPTVSIQNTGSNGANLKLIGNGGTTPNKTIRVLGGNFEICNSAYTVAPLQLTDAGQLTVTGQLLSQGATFGNGISFGNNLDSSTSGVAKHIDLWGAQYGFGMTAGRLNHVAGAAGAHVMVVAGVDIMAVNATGANVAGDLSCTRLNVNNATAHSMWNTGNMGYHQYAAGYYWAYDGVTGDVTWNCPLGALLHLRAADGAVWNNVSTVGGFGAYQNYSDARFKRNIKDAQYGLQQILQLNPVTFNRLNMSKDAPAGATNSKVEVGFLAADVQAAIPEAVSVVGLPLPDGSGGLDDANPTLAVSTDGILAAAVNAIKALTLRLVQAEKQIKALQPAA